MTLLIIYFSLAITVSFLCSLLEAVILSVTPTHIEVLVNHGHRSGLILRKLKEKIDYPLAAILTLNTVAHTVGAAGVGAQALQVFGSQSVALTSGIMTFCILVFSEIIPKTLGAVFWKPLAPMTAYLIKGFILITFPLVVSFQLLSRFLAGKREGIRITREEMIVAAELSKAQGELLDRERRVIKNLLRLNIIYAKDVMTPRAVMFALPENMTVGEVLANYKTLRFSRIPIFGRDLDDITGLVRRYQINQAYSQGRAEEPLKNLASPIHVVPESKSVAATLDEFIQRRDHIFLVVDEYGGTEGLITLEDAIETLLGVEIVDELDSVEDMRKLAVELWEKRKLDHHF